MIIVTEGTIHLFSYRIRVFTHFKLWRAAITHSYKCAFVHLKSNTTLIELYTSDPYLQNAKQRGKLVGC